MLNMKCGKDICTKLSRGHVPEFQTRFLRTSADTQLPPTGISLTTRGKPSRTLTVKDIPGPSPSLPFVGTNWQYYRGGRYHLKSFHETYWDKFFRYGPIVKEEFSWRFPVIHLFNPDDTETVVRRQGKFPIRPISEFVVHYRKKHPERYDVIGIANSLGDKWYKHRELVAPYLLKPNALQGLVDGVDRIGNDFIELLRAKRNPLSHRIDDFQVLAELLALEAVYLLTLDARLGCMDVNYKSDECLSMISAAHLLFEAYQELSHGYPLWKFFETKSYQKLDQAETIMYTVASKRIKEAIEKRQYAGLEINERTSILDSLLRTKDLSEKTVIVTVMDLITGGVHTVSGALTFLLDDIARNPGVQEKIYEELMEIVPDGKITKERLDSLHYLKACVKESFRMSPTIPNLARILTEDVTLSGYRIRAGTLFLCNFIIPCQQSKYFHEPEKFLPERWLNRKARPHPFALLPFGFSTRMCIGRRFSEMEMYTILAKLVYNFKIESCGGKLKSQQVFLIMPAEHLNVVLHDRNQN